jgi:hypothetical protein
MRSTPTEMQSMNENDFECLAKTRVNTPPMAKMTDDVVTGCYVSGGLRRRCPEVGFWVICQLIQNPLAVLRHTTMREKTGDSLRGRKGSLLISRKIRDVKCRSRKIQRNLAQYSHTDPQ